MVDCNGGSGGEVDGGGFEGEADCDDSGGEVDDACCEGDCGSEIGVGGSGGEVDCSG